MFAEGVLKFAQGDVNGLHGFLFGSVSVPVSSESSLITTVKSTLRDLVVPFR
jgi:hypothetical protein